MKEQDTDFDNKLRSQFEKLHLKLSYGTAGFRNLAINMPYIVYRTAMFVSILNKTQPSKCLGIVISASHNKAEDNGIKITNFKGNMLERHYQVEIEKFVNQHDVNIAIKNFKKYLISHEKSLYEIPFLTFIGGDTRVSTSKLLQIAEKGIISQGGKVLNFCLTTTPQLQYYVYKHNENLKAKDPYKQFTTQDLRKFYWQDFSKYVINCVSYLKWNHTEKRTIDCSNGIGGKIFPYFKNYVDKYLDIQLINNQADQLLNNKCGADYIKTQKLFPLDYKQKQHNSYVSFDGDADRIVFFIQKDKKLMLIDGDRIGTILTQFFNKIVQELALKTKQLNDSPAGLYINIPLKPSIGFVQTYYANSASSDYLLKNYKMEPVFAATGVKYLHQKAQHYDIGIYFQANGHGTVIFKNNYFQRIQAMFQNKEQLMGAEFISKNQQSIVALQKYFQYLQFFTSVCQLCNPAVGDAISNFFLFQIALKYLKYDYKKTLQMYTDFETLTSKINVKNKQACKVNEIEDKVLQPQQLQLKIQKIIQKNKGKKAFLRPSGTENLLRLHVEAETVDLVQIITKEITETVMKCPQLN